MSRLSSAVRRLVDNDDITYTGVDPAKQPVADGHDESRPWRLDPLPLVVSAARLGRAREPGWCNDPGCSTPCWPTCTATDAH